MTVVGFDVGDIIDKNLLSMFNLKVFNKIGRSVKVMIGISGDMETSGLANE